MDYVNVLLTLMCPMCFDQDGGNHLHGTDYMLNQTEDTLQCWITLSHPPPPPPSPPTSLPINIPYIYIIYIHIYIYIAPEGNMNLGFRVYISSTCGLPLLLLYFQQYCATFGPCHYMLVFISTSSATCAFINLSLTWNKKQQIINQRHLRNQLDYYRKNILRI